MAVAMQLRHGSKKYTVGLNYPHESKQPLVTLHWVFNATCTFWLSEGEYSALEHESVKGVVESLKVVTADKSKRIAKFAFDYATRNGRKKVTTIVTVLQFKK